MILQVPIGYPQIIGLFIFIGIPAVITGLLGRYIAIQKNRSKKEGFIFGFMLSLLGVLLVALLPNKNNQN